MLDELLHEAGDDGIEVCLSQAASVPPSEHEAVCQEYQLRYARAVEAMDEERGPATFGGKREDSDYPDWHRGSHLSYWESTSGFVYVALCQEGSSLKLVAGARPHPFERDTITLLPPPA